MTHRTWNQLSELEQIQCSYSDFHKSVHGFRSYLSNEISLEDAKQAMADLSVVASRVEAEEAEAEKCAIIAFETRVDALIACGAGDRETAIRWIFDGADEYERADKDYFCFNHGLPYGYFK